MVRTLHVYPSDGIWMVQKDGQRAETFRTKREAVKVALYRGRNARVAQVVVHSKDGQATDVRMYGLPRVQNLRKKGRLASTQISKAVGKVVLDRLRAHSAPTRVDTPAQ